MVAPATVGVDVGQVDRGTHDVVVVHPEFLEEFAEGTHDVVRLGRHPTLGHGTRLGCRTQLPGQPVGVVDLDRGTERRP